LKKHKKIAVVLVVFLLLIMTGCGKKTPKEMVIEALDNQLDTKSFTVKGKIDLGFDFNLDQDSITIEDQQVAAIFKNIGAEFEGKYQKDPQQQIMNMKLGFQGMNFEMDVYSKEQEIWMRIPMFPQYIYMNTEEMAEKQGIDIDMKKQQRLGEKLGKEFNREFFEALPEERFTIEKGENIEGNVKVDLITIHLDMEDVRNILSLLIEKMKSEEYKDLFFGVFPTNQELVGAEGDMAAFFEELQKMIEIDNLVLKMGIDSKSFIRQEEIQGAFTFKDPDNSKQTFKANFHIILNYDDFNRKIDFVYPDFEKEGVVNFEEIFREPTRELEPEIELQYQSNS
jgi:hypothetical protein